MDLAPLILRTGERASACGRVVAVAGQTWFEPPLPVRLPGYRPGHEPPPRPSALAVLVEGIDVERLGRRREKFGAVEGWTCLTGEWLGDHLVVIEQQALWGWPREATPTLSDPPCEPPPAGWPLGEVDENLDLEPELDGPEVVAVALFRPSSRQVVAVIASEDPERTKQRLLPALGARLCVVRSKWALADVGLVTSELRRRSEEWGLYEWGETVGEDGQARVTAKVARVLPSFASFAESIPDGLLRVTPWLAPLV